jgi:hypothetical protein
MDRAPGAQRIPDMNVTEGLKIIRARLDENGANDATIAHVDQILKRAAVPSVGGASAQSLLQLTRMLMRHPTASGNSYVYNDLALLEEQLEGKAVETARRAQDEANKPVPKSHKYYKELKEKQKADS